MPLLRRARAVRRAHTRAAVRLFTVSAVLLLATAVAAVCRVLCAW
jgi:hypothetical protein